MHFCQKEAHKYLFFSIVLPFPSLDMRKMATSLEELLAKEGFKGRRSNMFPRTRFGLEVATTSLYSSRDHNKSGPLLLLERTSRTKSDKPRYDLSDESVTCDTVKDRRERNNVIRREKLDRLSKTEIREKPEIRHSEDLQNFKRISCNSLEDLTDGKIKSGTEVVEIGAKGNERCKDTHSNKVHIPERARGNNANENREKENYKERAGKDIRVDKGYYSNSSRKHMLGRNSYSGKNRRNMKQPEATYGRLNRSSQNSKSFNETREGRHSEMEHTIAEPALDEVAVQAVISILGDYIKLYLKSEDFRILLHRNCFASLNSVELAEGSLTESKVIANLGQAIGTIERVVGECATVKELKRASLLLSVISSLNSSELKDGFTHGVPNFKLSACAHLYLSVIYKLQKKDRTAAKHLLQVFCDSPFQARTTLLTELWDHIFLPHLSHLTVWYNQEADSLADTPSKERKRMLLDKVYNDIMDSGTYQFALYYKDWLTDGVEAPSIPSIFIPSISVQGIQHSIWGVQQRGLQNQSLDAGSPLEPFSPHPRVSKNLYDAVFGRPHKLGVDNAEDYTAAESFDNSPRRSEVSIVEDKQISVQSEVFIVEDKQALVHSSETVKDEDQDTKPNDSAYPGDGPMVGEALRLHGESAHDETDINSEFGKAHLKKTTSRNDRMLHAFPCMQANELAHKKLAKSVFELRQTEESVGLAASTFLLSSNSGLHSDPLANLTNSSLSIKERGGNCDLDDGPLVSNIPREFICPLTGLLFEDPVTLETGQTFERAAITEWLNKGNQRCPVTGRILDYQAVPLTNFILKRVVDNWKSKNCNHPLDFASPVARGLGEYGSDFNNEATVLVSEHLLCFCGKEERMNNAKNLISLGGLQLLLRRFQSGNLEEKARVAALLSCCIEVDPDCRNQIARGIKKSCLLELLHSKEATSRASAVSLLSELICLNRRKDMNLFLHGLQNEGMVDTMHVLLVYLQSSPPEQRPLVAVLLLHFDLLVESCKYSIYREEAVYAIILALDGSLFDEKVRANCCRALLILGAHFSSRDIITEDRISKRLGILGDPKSNSLDNKEVNVILDGNISADDEKHAGEEWLRNLSVSLLGDAKKSFLKAISKCLGSGNLELVSVCLITVAWLSHALASLSDVEFQLSTFSALVYRLKESLENAELVEHKILASISLFNFSKIPECKVLLMTLAEEIAMPLRNIAEVSWSAKQLRATVLGEDP